MSQQYYRRQQQPQYQGQYGPDEYEEPYPRRRGLGPMGVTSIVLGVFCLALFILLMVVWSGKSSVQRRLRQEMITNSELVDKSSVLKRESGDLTRKIEYHKRRALATKKDTPLTGAGAPAAGTAAHWKARYERAKREASGLEMEANRCKAILEQAGRRKSAPTSPAPPGGAAEP